MVLEILFLFVTILLCITIAIAIKLFFDFKLGDKVSMSGELSTAGQLDVLIETEARAVKESLYYRNEWYIQSKCQMIHTLLRYLP